MKVNGCAPVKPIQAMKVKLSYSMFKLIYYGVFHITAKTIYCLHITKRLLNLLYKLNMETIPLDMSNQ